MATSDTPRRHNASVREWSIRAGLLIGSMAFALLVAEVIARALFPISDRRDNITLDGTVIRGFLEPGLVYRQVSNEYDVITTITNDGHRAPEVDDPDVVFIGDSFTFGWGLSDDGTFANLYCTRVGIKCANLGDPGSGTLRQVERLERYLDEQGWRPREVKLFFFGMSGSFSSGNDFVDNYDREQRDRAPRSQPTEPEAPAEAGLVEKLIALQPLLLRHSHLIRIAKFYAGPALRTAFIAEPGETRMAIALEATRKALSRLDELSRTRGFAYTVYLLVPVQDIMRGTAAETLATLDSVSPVPAIPTAPLFTESPAKYYFAFDGHLNAEGARLIADFLIQSETTSVAN